MGLSGAAFSSRGPPCLTPVFCLCCLQVGVTGLPGFTELWGAQAAAFTCTCLFSRSISAQNYSSESRDLWPLNFTVLKLPLAAFLASLQDPRGISHCSVFRGEAQAGKCHGWHHPAWLEAAPRAPSNPFSVFAAPPTIHRCCCDPLRSTDQAPSNSCYSFKTTVLLYLCIYDQQPRAADKP